MKLRGHVASISCMTSTENRLISASESSTTLVHDIITGEVVQSFTTPEDITALKVHPKNPNLLYYSSGTGLYQYDLLSNTSSTIYKSTEEINDIDVNEISIAVLDDSGLPFTIPLTHSTPKYFRKTLGHANIGNCIRWRPACRYDLVTGGCDATAMIWDASRGTIYDKTTFESGMTNPPWVYSCAFSSSGNQLALGLGDGSIAIYQLVRKKPKFQRCVRLETHDWTVSAIQFVGECLVAGGLDGKVVFVKEGIVLGTETVDYKVNCIESIGKSVFVGGTMVGTSSDIDVLKLPSIELR